VLQHADDGQHQPHDADEAVGHESLAEGRQDRERVEPGGEAGHEACDGHDEQRVQSYEEPDQDDEDTG
jgi:hypothetical protein